MEHRGDRPLQRKEKRMRVRRRWLPGIRTLELSSNLDQTGTKMPWGVMGAGTCATGTDRGKEVYKVIIDYV